MDISIFPIIGKENALPIFLTGVGGHENQHHILRSKGFPEYQFIYCVKGSGLLFIEGKEFCFHENTGIILYPGIIHEYYAVKSPWETHWLTFDGKSLPSLLSTLGFEKSEFVYINKPNTLDDILNQILMTTQSDDILKGYKCSSLIYNFLIELKVSISSGPPSSNLKAIKSEQLQPVLAYVEKNYNKAPTLEELSHLIQVSPQYLCRLFKNLLNMRPFEYINKRRIQEAKRLLLESILPIKEIAIKIGYNDASYFCSIFKKYENMSPYEFKNMYGNLKSRVSPT